MNARLRSALVAASLSVLAVPVFAQGYAPTAPLTSSGSFAQVASTGADTTANGAKTRAEVKAELANASANGTVARLGNDPHYPDDVQGNGFSAHSGAIR